MLENSVLFMFLLSLTITLVLYFFIKKNKSQGNFKNYWEYNTSKLLFEFSQICFRIFFIVSFVNLIFFIVLIIRK